MVTVTQNRFPVEPGIYFSVVPVKVFWRSLGLKGFLVKFFWTGLRFFGRALDFLVGFRGGSVSF